MPSGTKFATSVGIPMPRFTSMPDASSLAVRRAMMVCASMGLSRIRNQVVNDRRRSDDMIRRDHPHGNDVLGTSNNGFGSHRNHGVEIAGGQRIAQIAEIIGKKGLHQRIVRAQRDFEQ